MKVGLLSALTGALFAANASAGLDQWLGGGDCPWGDKKASTTHPQKDMPDTGVTRYYDFTVARATHSPDGVTVPVIVVNGEYPGPLIEANWGDWIEVNVQNEIRGPDDLTTIHWHGFNQPGTPYYDGVATISQCPIVPGGNLTYRFRADEYGTSWYHAHHSAQYSAGVLGPIVVHGPNEAEYDLDLGPILITDWFHDMYDHLVDLVMQPSFGPPFRPISDSNLVAGKGAYACVNSTQPNSSTCAPPSSFAAWEFEAGKTYRMRFVNTGSSAFEQISLDGHTFTVIANDFVPVQPYETDFVTIGVGQRTDVLVTANATPGQSYWLRAFNNPCGDTDGPYGYGIINYSGANCSIAPTSQGKPPPPNSRCQNDPLSKTVPQYAIPAKEPDTTITLFMDGKSDDQGYFHWTFNGNSYTGDLSQPDLFSAVQGQSLPPERNVYVPQGKTVRLIVYSNLPAPHPMHIHGHDFQVLAEGLGTWDGQIVNPSNPQRRDVHMAWFGVNTNTNTTAGGGDGTAAAGAYYMVLQYEQDNPGIWPFHCHIAWHLSKGMTIMLLELPEELAKIEIPEVVTATCERYKVWQAAANPRVGEGDAGS